MKRLAFSVGLALALLAVWTGLIYAQVLWEWHEGDDCGLWNDPTCGVSGYAVVSGTSGYNGIVITTSYCSQGVVSVTASGGYPGYFGMIWNETTVLTDIESTPGTFTFTTQFHGNGNDELILHSYYYTNPVLNTIQVTDVVLDCQGTTEMDLLTQLIALLQALLEAIGALLTAIGDLISSIIGLGGQIDTLTSALAPPAYSPIEEPESPTVQPTAPPDIVTEPGQLTVLYLPIVAKQGITATKPLNWLAQLNLCRSLAGQSEVSEDPNSSSEAAAHAIYLVRNDESGHEENPLHPGYSAAGAEAGMRSDILTDGNVLGRSDESAVQELCSNPFYILGLIDPRLSAAGYGSALDGAGAVRMAAVLDVSRQGQPAAWPVRFPGSGQTVPLQIARSLTSTQLLPDPRPGCDMAGAAGLPIVLMLGHTLMDIFVSDASLTLNGSPVDYCLFSDHTYIDFNSDRQYMGRFLLGRVGGIVLLPADPLTTGTYAVSITANETVYAWSFTVQ